MSNQNELKSLEKALSNENFKESYIIFLKIFKEIEFLKKNKEYTKNFLVLINREKVKLIYSEKENLLAESISEIFQNVELYSDDLNQTHRGGLFFKKQINNLFERELTKLFTLCTEKEWENILVEFLAFFLKHLKSNPAENFQVIMQLRKSKEINNKSFITLIKPIFDLFPNEILDSIINVIKSENLEGQHSDSAEILRILFDILYNNSRIYPDLFSEHLDLFMDHTITVLEAKRDYGIVIIQILKNIVESRLDLFELKFFRMLGFCYQLFSHEESELGNIVETIIKTIYNTHSEKIFQCFISDHSSNFNILFDLLRKEYEPLNTIIFEFFIDFTNYLKVYLYNGKITKELLKTYLKILEGTLNRGITSEYFLFSITNQLQLKSLENILLLKKNKNASEAPNNHDLKQWHQILITELRKYIKIVFRE